MSATAISPNVKIHDKFYINGQWVAPAATETIDVINSTTEEVMGQIPAGTAEDIDAAVAAAKAAFDSWSTTSVETRANYLKSIAEKL